MTSPRRPRCHDARPLLLIGLGLANAVACMTSSVEPTVVSVEPEQSYTDEAVRLTIRTSGVRGRLDIDLHAATDTRANQSAFQLLPEGTPDELTEAKPTPLQAVLWSDEDVFTADVQRGLMRGSYTVKVTNPDGRSAVSSSGAFQSLGSDTLTPVLSLLSPQDGTVLRAGAQRDAILQVADGYGQIAPPSGTTQYMDGQQSITNPQTFVLDGAAVRAGDPQLWRAAFTVPTPAANQAQASFTFLIEVTDGGGNTARVNAAFRAAFPPDIDAVIPAEGGLTGGAPFVIQGANFLPDARVLFGSDVALDVAVPSPGVITGRVPPHARPESVAVTVETLADQPAVLPTGFRYLAPPRLRGIEPATGPTVGEIPITAKGTDFRDTTLIFVGTGPNDKRQLFDCGTVLPPNKVTGCLVPASAAGTVKVWAEDPITGGDDADAVEFTYVDDASDAGSATATSPACATP
jgi:IPT/TIG domain